MPARAKIAALLACLIGSQAVADTLHVIGLRHRPAAEIQPLIQPLLLSGEIVSGSGYQLILRATDSRRREIEQLVAKLDVGARQLIVTVRNGSIRNERRARDAVSGRIGTGSARVILPQGSDTRSGLSYRGERSASSSSSTFDRVVRVQDGQRAFIRVGQSAPVVERVLTLTGRRAAVIAEGMRYEDFTSGFDVRPRVHGETVVLEITPRLTSPRAADGTYRFQELSTTITARLGEWVDLGSVLGESSDVNREILRSARSGASERATISIKVE